MMTSLTGFMGCGKSSVGKRLSELLCCPFMDLDSVIEERTGRSIPKIFGSDGEAAFRKMEAETLEDILTARDIPAVLALGGGTVMTPECASLIRSETFCIYLRASADTLVRNLQGEAAGRPMISQSAAGIDSLRERVEALLSRRSATYENIAHLIIDTDGKTIDEIAREIVVRI